MLCENCNKEHDGSYGSGRFCSYKCSRGFATKGKRSEINEKIGEKLKGKYRGQSAHKNVKKICIGCNLEFEIDFKHKHQLYCSKTCQHSSILFKEKVNLF